MSTTSDQRSRNLISSRTPDLTISGSDRPLDAGMLRTAEIVPGKTRKDRSKIMATPFTRLLVTVASLATVYSVVAASGNAWADDMTAVAHAQAEMAEFVQWHSGLIVSRLIRRETSVYACKKQDLTLRSPLKVAVLDEVVADA